MFQTTNQILSYIKYRNHQKDRNVLPGWYGWYWPHRVSRFNRCELPSYFCCEPIIEFLVPSFLLSFWRVQIAFIRDVLEVDQLTGFSEGKMLMQYYHGETIQSWDVLIYILYHIYPYLSISMDVHRTLIPWNLVHKQQPKGILRDPLASEAIRRPRRERISS